MTPHLSTFSSIVAPIETMAAQIEDADATGWTVAASVWSDDLDAYNALLRRDGP